MMRKHALYLLAILVIILAPAMADAQLKTMGKECRAQVDAANQLNDAGDYAGALAAFDAIVKKCDSKDGKEAVQAGRAHALNGLGNYTEAISAADAAQAAYPNQESLFAYFERAYAQEQMGNMEAATADYNRIIELTEMNQNVSERATIYLKVADLNYKAGKTTEAETYLAKAMELDPGNPDFLVLQGDWKARAGDYDAAFDYYDKAVAMGLSGVGMYEIRAEARLKQVQDKYGTTNAQELRSQMTPSETQVVCTEVKHALDLGLMNPQMDMFAALVCK